MLSEAALRGVTCCFACTTRRLGGGLDLGVFVSRASNPAAGSLLPHTEALLGMLLACVPWEVAAAGHAEGESEGEPAGGPEHSRIHALKSL